MLNFMAIDFRDVRIDVRQWRRFDGDARDDLCLLTLQIIHAGFHRRLIHAVMNGGDDALDRSLDLGQRSADRRWIVRVALVCRGSSAIMVTITFEPGAPLKFRPHCAFDAMVKRGNSEEPGGPKGKIQDARFKRSREQNR
jgi:hypothetical protein